MSLVNQTPQWQALQQHWEAMKDARMRDLFAADPGRAKKMSLSVAALYLDYSKNLVTQETLAKLIDLAEAVDLKGWTQRMFSGEPINNTERRAVLHIALRNRSNRPILVDGEDVMPLVNGVLARMEAFVARVRSGEWRGHTGRRITDVVNIGIGGSNLGPKMVCAALAPYQTEGLRVHFVSNVDGTHLVETVQTPGCRDHALHRRLQDLHHPGDHDQRHQRARLAVGGARGSGGGGPAFRRRVHQCRAGRRLRHRHRQHVRFLGLGRRALFAVVGHRTADRAGGWIRAFRRAAGGRPCHGRALPHRRSQGEHAGAAGSDRGLVRQLRRRPHPCGAALRSVAALPRRLSATGRHGEQRQARDPRGRRGRLHDRPGGLGRARHRWPARLLSAHPSGHPDDPGGFHWGHPQPQRAGRPSPQVHGQLLRPDRGADAAGVPSRRR